MDIVVWLRSLGLGKYEASFRDNEIDETVLPSLTEEHFKQVGERVKVFRKLLQQPHPTFGAWYAGTGTAEQKVLELQPLVDKRRDDVRDAEAA